MKWPLRRESTFDEAWDKLESPWAQTRRLSNEALIEALAAAPPGTTYRLALEAEQRHREAWRSPGGKAVWVSVVALLVSLGALIKSFVG